MHIIRQLANSHFTAQCGQLTGLQVYDSRRLISLISTVLGSQPWDYKNRPDPFLAGRCKANEPGLCGFMFGKFFLCVCFFVFQVHVLICLSAFDCQYQCNCLPVNTRLRNDALCAEWDVKSLVIII